MDGRVLRTSAITTTTIGPCPRTRTRLLRVKSVQVRLLTTVKSRCHYSIARRIEGGVKGKPRSRSSVAAVGCGSAHLRQASPHLDCRGRRWLPDSSDLPLFLCRLLRSADPTEKQLR